jgi:hypothetical protein
MLAHTAQRDILGCRDPLIFASTANGRFYEAEPTGATSRGAVKHHDLQAQALRLLSKVHQWASLEVSGTSIRSTPETARENTSA